MEILKKKILEKKELRGLPPEFLDKFLNEYELKHKKDFESLKKKNFNEKSKEFDVLKKDIRKKLRELHGVFSKKPLGKEKRQRLLASLKSTDGEKKNNIIKEILQSHQSTFERYDTYEEVYGVIFENNKQKKIIKILDLGCGYNPFSIQFMKCSPEYVAVDINKEDMEFINEYFSILKVKGKALTLDLTEEKNLKIIQKESENSDICLLFKLLDSLESRKRGSSLELLNHLNSRVLVVSFPLKTIGGNKDIKGKRKWFEKIISKNKYESKVLEIGQEKYYVLKQRNS